MCNTLVIIYCNVIITVGVFHRMRQDLRDIGVFQSHPTHVQQAHGCAPTDEDEQRDQLVDKDADHYLCQSTAVHITS